jgi:hypothetical protein
MPVEKLPANKTPKLRPYPQVYKMRRASGLWNSAAALLLASLLTLSSFCPVSGGLLPGEETVTHPPL